MPVIIETGAGDNPDANSYVDESELQAYASARGITLSGDPTQLLIQSTDYSETLAYKGRKASQAQPLQWPRENVTIDGYRIEKNVIPGELKRAQMVTALSIDAGRDPLAPIEPAVKSERVDVLEVEYQDGASSAAIDVAVSRAFSKLVSAGGGSANVIGVVRA